MKKIDGTLYSPRVNGQRSKMYVETSSDAVVMNDGTTVQDKLDEKSKGIVIATSKPSKECLWVNPSGITPSTYFDFSDVNVTPLEDSTPIHTLRTPADNNGDRTILYPLVTADKVKVKGSTTLQDVMSRYDMGFEVGRDRPDHKSLWANTIYETISIDDLGKEEEVVLLNEFLSTKVKVNNTTMNEPNYVFRFTNNNESLVMVFFDRTSDMVLTTNTQPNTIGVWIDDLWHIYQQNPLDLEGFLLDKVVIDEREYSDSSFIITYSGSQYIFINPDKFVASDTRPRVYQDTIWADTN